MSRRFVDLSIYLENDVVTDPPFMRPVIAYQTHAETMPEAGHFFPGITAQQLPGGLGFAAFERVTLTTHNGTHLDAPWHFHPTMDHGKRAITIDEVPLDWCFRPGVILAIATWKSSTISKYFQPMDTRLRAFRIK